MINIINENYKRGVSTTEIVKILYQDGGRAMYGIARGWVCLTLKTLEEENLIKRVDGKKRILFFP